MPTTSYRSHGPRGSPRHPIGGVGSQELAQEASPTYDRAAENCLCKLQHVLRWCRRADPASTRPTHRGTKNRDFGSMMGAIAQPQPVAFSHNPRFGPN